MHGSTGGTHAPCSLPWIGTSNACPAPCISSGSYPSQAQPVWLHPVVPPSPKAAELSNVVFGGAERKKGKKNICLVMLKETSYFKRLPPLCQILTCSWALCPGSSTRHGTVQAGQAQCMAEPVQGYYVPSDGQHSATQQSSRGGEGFSPHLAPQHTSLCILGGNDQCAHGSLPAELLIPTPSPTFPQPSFLTGMWKIRHISVYVYIGMHTMSFLLVYTLQRASKPNCKSCPKDALGAWSKRSGPWGAG